MCGGFQDSNTPFSLSLYRPIGRSRLFQWQLWRHLLNKHTSSKDLKDHSSVCRDSDYSCTLSMYPRPSSGAFQLYHPSLATFSPFQLDIYFPQSIPIGPVHFSIYTTVFTCMDITVSPICTSLCEETRIRIVNANEVEFATINGAHIAIWHWPHKPNVGPLSGVKHCIVSP